MKESAILRACMDYLAAVGVFRIRLNSGMQFGSYKGKSFAVKLGEAGTADILALVRARGVAAFVPVWLEIKNEKGKQSDAQKAFEDAVLEKQMRYFIICSVEDLKMALDSI